jgi:hypothetical protein
MKKNTILINENTPQLPPPDNEKNNDTNNIQAQLSGVKNENSDTKKAMGDIESKNDNINFDNSTSNYNEKNAFYKSSAPNTNGSSESTEQSDEPPTQPEDVVQQVQANLMEVSAIFPFQLFPDKIIVDRIKVTLITRDTIFHEKIFPIHIEDIKTVTVSTNLFFGTITFDITGYENNPGSIKALPKTGAKDITRLIMGINTLKRTGVKVEELSDEELKAKALEVGHGVLND